MAEVCFYRARGWSQSVSLTSDHRDTVGAPGSGQGPRSYIRLKIVEKPTELAIQTGNFISAYTEQHQGTFFHWTSVYNVLEVVNILLKPENRSISVIKGVGEVGGVWTGEINTF